MKQNFLVLLAITFAVVLSACGSDTTDVNSADEPPVEGSVDPVGVDPMEDHVEPEPQEAKPEDPEPDEFVDPVGVDPMEDHVEPEPQDAKPEEPEPTPDPLGGDGTLATIDIVITHPDAETVSYTISCLGDTATIIGDVQLSEFAACKQLGEAPVRERLLDGPPTGLSCTELYGGPDVATITGTYDGVDGPVVDTEVDRTNGCGIFDWDVLLSQVLPVALGIQ